MYLLGGVEGVDLDDVDVTSTVSDSTATYAVAGNEQLVKGVWTQGEQPQPGRRPRPARSSGSARCCAAATGRRVKLPYSFKVPKKAAGNRGQIFLTGGNDYYSEEYFYDEFGGARPRCRTSRT